MGALWRLWRRFVDVLWPQPVRVADRLRELRRSLEAEVGRRIVTETFAAENRAEAERAPGGRAVARVARRAGRVRRVRALRR